MLIIRFLVVLVFSGVLLGHLGWGAFKSADNYQIIDVDDDDDGDDKPLG
ncbi:MULTISPECIES: hypothetical protein [unclassified Rhizobium]|nr:MULTISPECIES: hypothetical protein [unclassified Rhizobium]